MGNIGLSFFQNDHVIESKLCLYLNHLKKPKIENHTSDINSSTLYVFFNVMQPTNQNLQKSAIFAIVQKTSVQL